MNDKNSKVKKEGGKNIRKKIFWVLKFAISAGITIFIIHKITRGQNLHEIGKMLSKIPLGVFAVWMAGAFLVKASGMFMAVVRWRLLLLGHGYKIGWLHLIGSFLIGRFIGSFTPSTTGLDGWRLYDIARHTHDTPASISVILVEKITGFFVLSVLVVLTIPFGGTIISNPQWKSAFERGAWFASIILGIPMGIAFVVLMNPAVIRKFFEKLFGRKGGFGMKIKKFVDALWVYENKKRLLLSALIAGFFVHLAQCVMYFFTGNALGLNVTLKTVLFIGPLEIAATLIPISIAGIGVRELVWATLLGGKLGGGDAGFAAGALMGFLGYAVGEGISLLGGPIWLARRSDYRMMREEKGGEINKDGNSDGNKSEDNYDNTGNDREKIAESIT